MEDQINKLKQQIRLLTDRVGRLEERRLFQQDYTNDSVKSRHMGEANRYLNAGLEADRPDGANFGNNVTYWFATDTDTLYIWNGTAWVSEVLT